jgi:hypothetical protein
MVDFALANIPFAVAFVGGITMWSGYHEEVHIRRIGVVLEALRAKGVQLS